MKRANKIYLMIYAITLFVAFAMIVVTHGNALNSILYSDALAYFMDFFDVLAYGINPNVYNEMAIVYPPFALLMMRMLEAFSGHFIYPHLNVISLRSVQEGIICFFVVFMIFLMVLMFLVHKKVNGDDLQKCLTSFVICLSTPVVLAICRGNITLFAAVFVVFFVFWMDSEDKRMREASLISLALAFNIHLPLGLLGVLLLTGNNRKERIKEFVRFAMYALVIFFVSFFFFNNPVLSFMSFFNNTMSSGAVVTADLENSVSIITSLRRFAILLTQSTHPLYATTISRMVSGLILVIALIGVFFEKKMYRRVMILSVIVAVHAEMSWSYNLVYLIAPFVLFLNETDFKELEDKIYGIAYYLIFGSILCHQQVVTLMFDSVNNVYRFVQIPIMLLGVGALIMLVAFDIKTLLDVKNYVFKWRKPEVENK